MELCITSIIKPNENFPFFTIEDVIKSLIENQKMKELGPKRKKRKVLNEEEEQEYWNRVYNQNSIKVFYLLLFHMTLIIL